MDDIYASLGGREALTSMRELSFHAEGATWVEFQQKAFHDLRQANTFSLDFDYLVDGRRFRIEHHRAIQYPLEVERDFTHRLADQAGFTDGQEGIPVLYPPGAMRSNKAAAHVEMFELMVPHLLIRGVLDGRFEAERQGQSIRVTGGPVPVTLNLVNGEIASADVLVNDTLVGDRALQFRYQDWRDDGPLRGPHHVTLHSELGVLHEETRDGVAVDADPDPERFELPAEATEQVDAQLAVEGIEEFTFHHAASSLGVPFPLPQDQIQAQPLAPGVFFLAATHNSLVVEQAEGVVVVEAPLAGGRSAAIAAWIDEQLGKPVTHVVTTHHHFDHAGGARQFVAHGAALVIAEPAREFFEQEVLGGVRSVLPDDFAKSKITPMLNTVPSSGELRLDDATHPVVVHHYVFTHAADMLLVELPNDGVLFTSDLYNPLPAGAAALGLKPYFEAHDLVELGAALEQLGLAPVAIAGGHGIVADQATFASDLQSVEQ